MASRSPRTTTVTRPEPQKRWNASGGRGFLIGAELGAAGDVDELFGQLSEGLAGRRLDILVDKTPQQPAGPITTNTVVALNNLFAVNVPAPYFLIQRLLPVLRDGGRIIPIKSAATRFARTPRRPPSR